MIRDSRVWRLLIAHIFHLTCGFGTVCGAELDEIYLEFNSFMQSVSQIKLVCFMSKNSSGVEIFLR